MEAMQHHGRSMRAQAAFGAGTIVSDAADVIAGNSVG
jgi:hypothetical protein